VCGTKTFTQSSVPICGGRTIPGMNCPDAYTDKNPFWYKFTCYATGTLGFTITPHTLEEDYDWQLFDVTNRSLSQVFTNNQLFVASGWSGEYGITGASNAGAALEVCGGFGQPLWSSMPTIQKGHDYLLLISHFSDSQSGYDLKFNGGTASITDPLVPQIDHAGYHCGLPAIGVKLNKKVQCKSLAANGSDFVLGGAGVAITGATGVNCTNGFDMDSIVLTLSGPLPAGNYTVRLKTGTDGNSLLDACENSAGTGNNIPPTAFTVAAYTPSYLDHIVPVSCAPQQVQVVLSQPVRCSSIAPNGTDFSISGTSPINIQSAAGLCHNGLADTIVLQLSTPVYRGGAYQVTLKPGSDGNTLLSECWQPSPAGTSLPFNTSDTVNASFTYTMHLHCEYDTVVLSHNGANGVNKWIWNSDGNTFSTAQNPVKSYDVFGPHTIQLTVSNGVCTDSSSQDIVLTNELHADFTVSADILCPQDAVTFVNKSTGSGIVGYMWQFGNGVITTTMNPLPQIYPQFNEEREYDAMLIVQSNMNCFDTAHHIIKAVPSCYIDVPTGFTPNGDGINDYLYPLNGYKAINLKFSVFNRLGQLIFETNDWRNKWDGTVNGRPQPVGTYAWMLSYTNKDTGEKVFKKGVSVLLR
ncbi:MAG TPA: gliding motility-associated C-terminal domain-containing protein, partial [Chitinophaga sp.]|uniref:T9SS type B sorting domain-containing protein n=1 Tax=Chitinophaga sp. TaxID=1869181 RepID=UPI002DBDA4C4